jgi:hypothetical protein
VGIWFFHKKNYKKNFPRYLLMYTMKSESNVERSDYICVIVKIKRKMNIE